VVFEAVSFALDSEQQIAEGKAHARLRTHVFALARHDDIDLVAIMRGLWVWVGRPVPACFKAGRVQDLPAQPARGHGQPSRQKKVGVQKGWPSMT
jgi:hypothetical protein